MLGSRLSGSDGIQGISATLESTRPPPSTTPPTRCPTGGMHHRRLEPPIFHNTCSFRSANARAGAGHVEAPRFRHTTPHRTRTASGMGMAAAMTHTWMGERHRRTATRRAQLWYRAPSRFRGLSWRWAGDTFRPKWNSTCGRTSGSSGCPSGRWGDIADALRNQKTETETEAPDRRTIQCHPGTKTRSRQTLAKWQTEAGRGEYRARRPA